MNEYDIDGFKRRTREKQIIESDEIIEISSDDEYETPSKYPNITDDFVEVKKEKNEPQPQQMNDFEEHNQFEATNQTNPESNASNELPINNFDGYSTFGTHLAHEPTKPLVSLPSGNLSSLVQYSSDSDDTADDSISNKIQATRTYVQYTAADQKRNFAKELPQHQPRNIQNDHPYSNFTKKEQCSSQENSFSNQIFTGYNFNDSTRESTDPFDREENRTPKGKCRKIESPTMQSPFDNIGQQVNGDQLNAMDMLQQSVLNNEHLQNSICCMGNAMSSATLSPMVTSIVKKTMEEMFKNYDLVPKKRERFDQGDNTSSDSDGQYAKYRIKTERNGHKVGRTGHNYSFRGIQKSPKEPKFTPATARTRTHIPASAAANTHSLKNIDKSLYLKSNKAKICPVCSGLYTRMVYHFKSKHADSEVFVARPSPQMAEYVKQTIFPATKYFKLTAQYVRIMCLFCETEKNFPALYWVDHYRTHTGEYTNECVICEKKLLSKSHCGMKTITHHTCDIYGRGLVAFICNICNYTQINEDNIKSHLQTQHNEFEHLYQSITLLPALLSLPLQAQEGPNTTVATNQSASSYPPSSGIRVLDQIVIKPANKATTNDDDWDISCLYGDATEPGFINDQNLPTLEHQQESRNNPTLMETQTVSTAKNDFKYDAAEEDELLNANNASYNTLEYNVIVRPWIDEDYARHPAIDLITLFALYKCMHEPCLFATDSVEMWKKHMDKHILAIDAYNNRLGKPSKEKRAKMVNFRECCYCTSVSKSNGTCVAHMEHEHRRDIFQCPYCFYRTIEMDNMVCHHDTYHMDKAAEILLCGEKIEFEERDKADYFENVIDSYIKKIKCGQDDCTDEFVNFNSLVSHLVVIHPGAYTCPYCQTMMDSDESTISNHMKLQHPETNFEEFQCIHCEAGFNDVDEIRHHMSKNHASQFLFVAARRSKNPHEDTDEPQFVNIGNSQNYSQYTLFKCSNSKVLNSLNPNVLDPKKHLEMLSFENQNPNMKVKYHGQIPRISFAVTADDYLIQYKDYQLLPVLQNVKPFPLTVEYKCLTSEMVDQLSASESVLDHIQAINNTCVAYKIKSPKDMLDHQRRSKCHSKQPIIYLQIEKSQFEVYKIVRCKFQCQICDVRFESHAALKLHFWDKHRNSYLGAKMVLESEVIESNDPSQAIKSKIESLDFFYCSVFICNQHDGSRYFGSKAFIIDHYNKKHDPSDIFDVKLGEYIFDNAPHEIEPYMHDINEIHQMYLFECQHCSKLFESYGCVKDHFKSIRDANSNLKTRFTIKKLFACPEDKTIRTFSGLKCHYASEHPQKAFTAVNVLFPMRCGLCNVAYKDISHLSEHYAELHTKDEFLAKDEKVLQSLEVDETDISKCIFAPGCCIDKESTQLRFIVQHALKCSRRFICDGCPNDRFDGISPFVRHCMTNHGLSLDTILEKIQNFKYFLALLSDMIIICPNGLVVTKNQIAHFNFGDEIMKQITSENIQELFNTEQDLANRSVRSWFNSFTAEE